LVQKRRMAMAPDIYTYTYSPKRAHAQTQTHILYMYIYTHIYIKHKHKPPRTVPVHVRERPEVPQHLLIHARVDQGLLRGRSCLVDVVVVLSVEG
jgi:hypothetical protein